MFYMNHIVMILEGKDGCAVAHFVSHLHDLGHPVLGSVTAVVFVIDQFLNLLSSVVLVLVKPSHLLVYQTDI